MPTTRQPNKCPHLTRGAEGVRVVSIGSDQMNACTEDTRQENLRLLLEYVNSSDGSGAVDSDVTRRIRCDKARADE